MYSSKVYSSVPINTWIINVYLFSCITFLLQCVPFWPEIVSEKLCVRVIGCAGTSKPFFFNKQDNGTLLVIESMVRWVRHVCKYTIWPTVCGRLTITPILTCLIPIPIVWALMYMSSAARTASPLLGRHWCWLWRSGSPSNSFQRCLMGLVSGHCAWHTKLHQTRPTTSLWTSLCAQWRYHAGTGKGISQTVITTDFNVFLCYSININFHWEREA